MSIANYCFDTDLNIHVTWKKLQRTNMLGTIPHEKFSLYHFPTRGRAGVKLGDAWYVSNVSIIFLWFHAVILSSLVVLCTFYIFFGTNLLIQCQVPVPVFSVFLALFRSDFGTESKRNKNPEMIFSRTEELQGAFGPSQVGSREPTSPEALPEGTLELEGFIIIIIAPPMTHD